MTTRSPSVPLVGEECELGFTDLLSNGQGVGRFGSLVVFVWGPLPGERARVRVTLVKAKYAVGELLEVTEPAPNRAVPFCSVFGTCGGCQVQHLAYDAQLAWKQGLVRQALARIGGLEGAQVSATIGMANPRAYRNKMALVVDAASGVRRFGFYQARSHDVVPIDSCPIVLPQLDSYIARLGEIAETPAGGEAFAGAKHVVARVGRASGQSVISITTERPSPTLPDAAAAVVADLPGVVGLENSYEPHSPNAVMGRKHVQTWGRKEMEECIEGVNFRVSAASFFQVNSEMVGQIFEFLGTGLTAPRRMLDLYCGAGTFSIYFARMGSEVVGVEENPHAVREAQSNARLNEVEHRVRFIAGRVEATLKVGPGRAALERSEIVFLDPPRKGSDEAALDALVAARVPNIWYLSCNPATLARDLAHLHARGYRLGVVAPFDMFPQTGHVETLAALWFPGRGERIEPRPAKVADVLPEWTGEFSDFAI